MVVHGGGKQMTRYLAERGVESRFVNGLRVTTPETLDAVLKVFAGSVNHELVASLNRAGALGGGAFRNRRLPGGSRANGPRVGRRGARDAVQPGACLHLLTANGYLPVVACVAGDRQGRIYNVNADQMAVACAVAFGAETAGLPDRCGRRAGCRGEVRPVLTAAESRRLIAGGIATGGMQAKLNAAVAALRRRRGPGPDRARRRPRRAGAHARRRGDRHPHGAQEGSSMISGASRGRFRGTLGPAAFALTCARP